MLIVLLFRNDLTIGRLNPIHSFMINIIGSKASVFVCYRTKKVKGAVEGLGDVLEYNV